MILNKIFLFRVYKLWIEEYFVIEYGNLILRVELRVESNDRVFVGEDGIFGRDLVRYFL